MVLISEDVRCLREVAEMHNEVLGADLPWQPFNYSRTPSVQKSRTPVICKFSAMSSSPAEFDLEAPKDLQRVVNSECTPNVSADRRQEALEATPRQHNESARLAVDATADAFDQLGPGQEPKILFGSTPGKASSPRD